MTLAFWVGYAAAELAAGGGASARDPACFGQARVSTRPRCRCSIPGAGAPRSDTSGRWRVTTGLGQHGSARGRLYLCAWPRRGACHQAARRLLRHRAVRRLCGLQAIGSIAGAAAAPRHSPSAGRIGEGGSMRSRKPGEPRSRRKRSRIAALYQSRSESAAAAPTNAKPCAKHRASRSSML